MTTRLDECRDCGIPATVTPQRADGTCEDREGCETRQKHSDEDERVRTLAQTENALRDAFDGADIVSFPRNGGTAARHVSAVAGDLVSKRPIVVAASSTNPIDILFDGIRQAVFSDSILALMPAWLIDEVTRIVTEQVEGRIYGYGKDVKSRAIVVIHELQSGHLRVEPRFSPSCSVLAPHGAARFALQVLASANNDIVAAEMGGEKVTNTAAANSIARGARAHREAEATVRAGGDGDRLPPGARTTRARRRR